jgi:hypothetical protein
MGFIDKKIDESDLKLTKEGFFKLYNEFRGSGMSMQRSYNRIAAICLKRGYQNYYASFGSCKAALYAPKSDVK